MHPPVAAIAAAALSVLMMTGIATADERLIDYDITTRNLGDALSKFAVQSRLQLVYPPDLVEDISAAALRGRLSPRAALEKLLAGSGLEYEFVTATTLILRRKNSELQPAAAPAATGTAAPGNGASGHLRLARTPDTDRDATTGANSKPEQQSDTRGIPEMLVKGQRSANTGIRRTEDDVQPYVVFEADEIARSMAGNLEQFLKTRLPMNAVAATTSQLPGEQFGSQSQIDLRGLGTSQTLVLVNGRRQPSVTDMFLNGNFRQPDLNGIPLSAVERIEILPSTASGIYGGGATGGVVNVVLRQDYAGMEFLASHDNSFDTDSGRTRLEASAGFSFEGGRSSVLVSVSHSQANPLLIRDRDFSARARALQLANDPAGIYAAFQPPVGNGFNIRSATGLDLVSDGGQSLGSPFTFAPAGYPGVTAGGTALLAANAGQYDLSLPDDGRADVSLLNHPTVRSAGVSARRQWTSWLESYADLSMADNRGQSRVNVLPGTLTVSAAAPNNPFDSDITVSFPTPALFSNWRSTSETASATGGLIFRLPRQWAAHLDYSWGRSRYKWASTLPAVSSATYDAVANGDIDVLQDGRESASAYAPYLLPSPNFFDGPVDTVLQNAAVRLAGPALELPGGDLALSVLLERRREEARDSIREDFFLETESYSYAPARKQDVDSVYLEATVPLVSARNARRGLRGLDLQASIRRDEYQTTTPAVGTLPVASRTAPRPEVSRLSNQVASTDYTVGLRYSPVPDLTLRASFGTGFLPPSIAQLASQTYDFNFLLAADPKREGFPSFIAPVTTTVGGSPDLQAENSESLSAGVVLTPSALPGLRLSLDYTRISKTDEIFNLSDQEILDNEERLPGRVVRAPLTALDMMLGYSGGQILSVDKRLDNIARTELEAWDVQVDYTWATPFGAFHFFALASHQPRLERQVQPGAPLIDSVGFLAGPLAWRGNGGLTWERDNWTAAWSTQFYDSYRVYFASGDPALRDAAIRGQGASSVGSQTYHDLTLRYRFDDARWGANLLSGTDLTIGLSNVLNTSPPTLASTSFAADGYGTHADPRLRVYSVVLRKEFGRAGAGR